MLVTNNESSRVSVVRGIMVVTHTLSDELLQYANERQDQAVMASMVLVTASGGTPTDHPQSVH